MRLFRVVGWERDQWKLRAERAQEEARQWKQRCLDAEDDVEFEYARAETASAWAAEVYGQYLEVLEERDAAASLAERRYRPMWTRVVAASWLVVLGVLIGGSLVPHVDDAPRIVESEPLVETGERYGQDMGTPVQPGVAREQSFAWAPLNGADSYRIQFWQGATLVWTGVTGVPHVIHALVPGSYRWVVWPIRDGVQGSRAIVDSVTDVS